MLCGAAKQVALLAIALAMTETVAMPLTAEHIRQWGDTYAVACDRTDGPRIRLSVQFIDVEVGTQRLRALNPQDMSLGMFGRMAPPPDYVGALGGTVQPDLGILFTLKQDKVGQYFTIEGDPKIEAALGKALLKQKFRRCKS